MKKNVKVDGDLLDKVKRRVKKTKQTVGGFFEAAAEGNLGDPKYNTGDNSNAFCEFLTNRGIKYKDNGSFTTVIGVSDPIALGVSFGIYKRENDPSFKSANAK